jgi:glycosyltransferase involved in cell wall biosynthesis
LIERHGLASRVQLLGHRDDTEQMLAAADIYCQPNDGAEPFGLSFVEALGAGLPVVATRLGALPEIVDDSCGILVAPQSPPDVALALSTLLDDAPRRARLARGARARAAVLGDVERRTGELADALEWAMSPARG